MKTTSKIGSRNHQLIRQSPAWEECAETWAHYLHLIDLVETAYAFSIKQRDIGSSQTEPRFLQIQDPFNRPDNTSLEDIVRQSASFNVLHKLKFIDDVLHQRLVTQ